MKKAPILRVARSEVGLIALLSVIVTLTGGCGYSLELSNLDDQRKVDPITMVRRELRQVKADHRVAVFDLRKEQKNQISRLKTEMNKIRKTNKKLIQSVAQFKRDLGETRSGFGQKNADIDERFAEVEIQHRLIHGRIEEEANRSKERIERGTQFSLNELEVARKRMTEQDALRKKLQKSLQDRLVALKTRERESSQALQDQLTVLEKKVNHIKDALQTQIDLIQKKSVGIQQSTEGQKGVVQAVSDQVSQIVDKMVPAVNKVTARLDDLEWQFKKLDDGLDVKSLNRRLTALTDAINVQRQSLEMLGNTITPQIDKQRGLLKKMGDRLDHLEVKKSPKQK